MAASRIYFAIGVPFEGAWLKRFMAANSRMLTVQHIGGRIVVADPPALDWAKNLLSVARAMAGATE